MVAPGYYPVHYRHNNTANVGFLDGHVKSLNIDTVRKQQPTEDGTTLTGIDQYVFWNRF